MRDHIKLSMVGAPAFAAALSLLVGCGLVTHGVSQTLHLQTMPGGAQASFAGHEVTTPADLTVSRRNLDWEVLSVTKDGYDPACVVIACAIPKYVQVLDSL